jgi:predicted MPP superfamily phosphohydrolase
MPKIRATMDGIGLRVLVNESAALEPGLYLAGFDDHDTMGMDPERAFRTVPKRAAAIVMGHNPLEFGGMRLHSGVMFSGHTHGGQVAIWPVPALVAGATQGRVAGWYSAPGARLLVNRGIGTVNLPFRMFSRPEVAVVDLVADDEPPVRQGLKARDRGTT